MFFKRKNKTEEKAVEAVVEAEAPQINPDETGNIVIKVLGTGCANCEALLKSVKEAIQQLDIQADYQYVDRFEEIAQYGVMVTPALVINDKVVSYGKALSTAKVKKLIERNI